MRRNLACSLFLHGRVRTTPEKAKEVRSFVEKLVTLARESNVANFRRALALLDDRFVVRKLFREIGPAYRDRPGGYTRILKLDVSANRLGDNAAQVIFELVTGPAAGEAAGEEEKKKTVRERLARFGRKEEGKSPEAAQAPEAAAAEPKPEAGAEAPAETEQKQGE